ncbi:MAG: endonuclease/exonuclease/phosphatase family protein [Dehalococcoidia bacterium]|nr:endonuclease/exonuclease/phosphatase family protein [Dehalococcoidia bacterium]
MTRRTKTIAKRDGLSVFAEWLAARPLLTELTLTALTVLFGMQVLRVLVPGMFWTLGGRMGLGAIELGIIGVAIFLIGGFLAGPLGRLAGNRRLIVITAVGLGIMRLFMQVWWDEPLFNLSLAIIGTILFFLFLPACFEDARLRGGPAISHYALGLLGGLALDIAINGAFGTYDTVWQVEPLPLLLTLLLVIIQLALLVGFTPTTKPISTKSHTTKTTGISMARSFTWLAIGPFLFLELVVFQNIPRVATLTGWSLPIAFGLTLLAQLAGLAAAAWLLSKPRRTLWPWALGAGVLLPAVLTLGYQKPAALIALIFLVGQVLLSMLIVMVLIGITTSTGKTQRSGAWIANGIGMVLFLALILAYYAVYDISLPYKNAALEPIAGGIIAACAICALVFRQQEIKVDPKLWLAPVFALILLVLPLAGAITWRTPTAVAGQGFPVHIMTYNLHNGFNTKGKLNMEEIAQVIERNNPDIVALQEVSRGWVVSGRVDMLAWLSWRLNMPYVFGPTADQFWGNAILSRYPILAYSRHDLPPRDLFILRGFVTALIDMGNGQQIKVINTHFHHLEGQSDIRQLQSQTILDFLTGFSSTILLGDLNAESTDREIAMFLRTNLRDTAAYMKPELAYTFASDNPHQRIDYIWISYDLRAVDVQVPLSTASDHFPVVAVIYK